MNVSIVCIGDMHFKPGDRQADRERALDQIIREGLALPNLGAWLVTGDVFDAGAAAKDCNGIDERFQQMAAVAPVIVAYGNHDRPGDLDGFGRLQSTYPIHVIDRPQTVRVKTPLVGGGPWLSVFVLPYPHKGGLVGAGIAPGAVVATAADLLEPMFMEAADDLVIAAAAGDLVMMMGHVNVSGAIASTGQPNIGHEIELSPRHLDRLGGIPKILGHIHKPQQIAGAYYVGSICRLDYGEIEEKRWIEVGFTDEDTGDDHARFISHPIDVAPMFHVEGELVNDESGLHFALDNGDDEIRRRYDARDWDGCDVRLRYRYQASERPLIIPYVPRLVALFSSALRFKSEGLAQANRQLRAPAVATAKTLPEKLAAYRMEPTLAPSVLAKLDLLEHQDEATLLGFVTTELAAIEQPERATVAA